MFSFLRSGLMMAAGAVIAVSVSTLPTRAADDSLERIDKLERQVDRLQKKLEYMRVEGGPIEGLAGPHVIFEGCNVHVRSGAGTSVEGTVDLEQHRNIRNFTPIGLGNLVIGYDEQPLRGAPAARGGSHNLIVGPGHEFPDVCGVVFGQENKSKGPFATVTGGFNNNSTGYASSVTAGKGNKAGGEFSSVTGGSQNLASGFRASILGGERNEANGFNACISGGGQNRASGDESSVSGGGFNKAVGRSASVSGGNQNTASEYCSSVSGGLGNTASGISSSVSGGISNTASDFYTSVSGGRSRSAPANGNWAAGGLFQAQ